MNYYTDVLKKYAVFTGRATRKEYWMFFLINLVISIVLGLIERNVLGMQSAPISSLYSLAVLLPSIGVGIRRLHDTNRSGWWLLIALVPLVGAIVLIVFLATDSLPGENQYGPNPKGMASTPMAPAAKA